MIGRSMVCRGWECSCSAAFRNAIVTSPFFRSGGDLIAPAAYSLLQITDLAIIPLGAGVQGHGWQLGHESGVVGERYMRPAEKAAVLVERFCDCVSEVSGKVLLRIYRAR